MKPNTPTNILKSSAAILAELEAGKSRIATAAESYQTALAEKQAAFKSFQTNPAAVPVSEAVRIITEMNGLTELAERFDAQLVDFLQRQHTDEFFISHKVECVSASTAELTAILERQPGFVERVKVGLVATITKAWDKATGREDRDKLLAERDAQEEKLAVLETNISFARAAIVRFETLPTAQHFGECQSAIGFVKSSLA